MRKISTLLMLFCAFVGTAWAQSWTRPLVSTDADVYEYYIRNARNGNYFVTTTKGLNGGAQELGTATSFGDDKAKVTFKLTESGKLYSTNTTTPLLVGYTSTGEGGNSVQLFENGDYTWNVEAATNGVTLCAGSSSNSWNMYGGAGANVGLYSKTDGGANWVFVPANEKAAKATKTAFEEEFSPEFFYQFKNVAYSTMLSSGANKAKVTSTNSVADPYQLWQVEYTSDGKCTLKNAGSGKYLNYATTNNTAWAVTETPAEFTLKLLAAATGETPAKYAIQSDLSDDINCAHDANWGAGYNYEQVVRWYSSAGASQWNAVKTSVAVGAAPVSFTYSLIYGGIEKFTQTCNSFVGSDYPEVSVELPFGLSAVKPSGTLTSEVNGTTVTIELTENLPFVYAADYASITKWYYLKFDSDNNFYLHHDAGQNHIDLSSKSVDVNNKDIYSWAFVGNPFDGYQIVNKGAGEGYILSSSTTMAGSTGADTWPVMTATPVPEGNNTHWIPTASTHATNGFFLAQKGYASNRLNNRGKLAYWTGGAGTGSTFVVELRDMTGRADLQTLVDEVVAANYTAGDAIGYYTQTTVDAVNVALTNAKSALEGEMNEALSAEHQTAIRAAVAALVVNMPTSGAYYRLKNVYRNKYVSANASGRVPVDADNSNASLIWTLEQNGSNYTIKNLNYGNLGYMKAPGGGNELVSATDATAYTLKPFGDGQFALLEGNNNLVIYGGGNIGVWWNSEKGSDGAWIIEPATELDVTVTEAGYATLNLPFDVTLPNTGVKAYAVETVEGGYASLVDKTDIPANQGAILEGAGTHTLTIAPATSDWSKNLLLGTNVNTEITDEAYVLGNGSDGVGLYKALMTEGKWLNNANKAYLPASVVTVAGAKALRFNFGGTTAIESVLNNGIDANAAIYDLSGRRVEKAVKGIYIQNGKKIIVK